MSTITSTTVRTPVVTIAGEAPSKRPSVRADLESAALILAVKKARVIKYKRRPAKNAVGEALPMPLRFTIALNTAQKRFDTAVAKYEARYGTGAAKRALTK